jgi:hypothetical protein
LVVEFHTGMSHPEFRVVQRRETDGIVGAGVHDIDFRTDVRFSVTAHDYEGFTQIRGGTGMR